MMLHKISIDKPIVNVIPLGYLKPKHKDSSYVMTNVKIKTKPKKITVKR